VALQVPCALFFVSVAQGSSSSPWPGGMERYSGADMEARKKLILRRGLVCQLKAKKLHGKLFCLVVRPVEGFVRLATPSFERKCLRDFGAYHISIGFDVAEAATLENKLSLSFLMHVNPAPFLVSVQAEWRRLRKVYNGARTHHIKIRHIGSGYSVALDEADPVHQDLKWAHGRDWYAQRDIHASL